MLGDGNLSAGVLQRCYDENDIQLFNGQLNDIAVEGWESAKKISLREAVSHKRSPPASLPSSCRCQRNCSSKRTCPCRQKNLDCNAKCHKDTNCTNKESQGSSKSSECKNIARTSKPTSIVCKCVGNSCTLKNKCSCRLKGTICGLKCHRRRRCCNASKALPGPSQTIIDSDSSGNEDHDKIESGNWWIQQEQLSVTDE